MKRKIAGLMMALALCGAVTAAAVQMPAAGKKEVRMTPAAAHVSAGRVSPVSTQKEQTVYILRERGGKICIFTDPEAQTPAVITGISAAGLPTADRETLKRGIAVETYEEVVALLEDFGS